MGNSHLQAGFLLLSLLLHEMQIWSKGPPSPPGDAGWVSMAPPSPPKETDARAHELGGPSQMKHPRILPFQCQERKLPGTKAQHTREAAAVMLSPVTERTHKKQESWKISLQAKDAENKSKETQNNFRKIQNTQGQLLRAPLGRTELAWSLDHEPPKCKWEISASGMPRHKFPWDVCSFCLPLVT